MCGGAAPDNHGHSHWVQVCLLLRIALQDALSEVTFRVFVYDITALNGRNKESVVMAEKVLRKLERAVQEKGLKLSITHGRKRRKEHGNHFLQMSGRKVSGMQQR